VNILLISRCPPFPLQFGDRLIPYHLAQELTDRQHVIDLLAFYNRPEDITEIPRYGRLFRVIRLIREPRRGSLAYFRRLYLSSFFPESAAGAWSKPMWNAIQDQLAETHYDAIHVFGGIQVYEYQQLVKNFPNIIVPYESFSLYLESAMQSLTGRARLMKKMELSIARRYERKMFNGYDQVVVLADADAQALRTLQPDLPLRVIPNGVDTNYFSPSGQDPDQPTLTFIGNYEYEPNVDAALRLARRIFPYVQHRVPGAKLLLVGRAPPAALRELASDSIQVTGPVVDVRPYLDRTLIFVSALRIGAGLKNKLLEAMAMQKAIVATPLSCDGIAVQHEQHLLIADSSDDIAKAVVRLVKDGDLRHRLGLAGRELVEKQYTWHRVGIQYETLYREVALARFKREGQ
jgi:glycosyltransferase involved in cell wall biosynthesis